MKKINLVLASMTSIILMVMILSSFTTPEEKIIGTWVLENSNPQYKLVFTNDGKCTEYEDNVLLTTYTYSIENNSCGEFSASNTLYLKWVDQEDQSVTCFELSAITDTSLSLMIIDKGKIMYFNKQ